MKPSGERSKKWHDEPEDRVLGNPSRGGCRVRGWHGGSARNVLQTVRSGLPSHLLDWAVEMARLLDGRYALCEKIILVCDNLNTHTKGAFYAAFEPERARQLVRRIEFRHTPKHGSWLNIAENELSSLTRQCVAGRRFGNINTLREETEAWSSDVNETQRGVHWHMKIDDARSKLTSVYPNIKK
jgi:hypothetical protein